MSTSPIQPPPSVDDLLGLGADSRVGNVDFATRLVPAPSMVPPVVEVERPMPAPTSLAQRRPVGVPVPVLVLDDDLEDKEEAPAEIAAELQSEVEVDVEPEVVPEAQVEAEVAPAPRPRPKTRRPATKPALEPKRPEAETAPKPARKPARVRRKAEPEPEPTMTLPQAEVYAGPTILPVAQFDVSIDETPTSRIEPEPIPEPILEPAQPIAQTEPVAPTRARAREDGYLGLSVQEVADSAIERLLEAENAALQHLAALEAEAARRAEMLTAQAELDAELIRITARREAHAIITAARAQAGVPSKNSRDARELAEISDAVSRFAESMESSIALPRPNQQGELS